GERWAEGGEGAGELGRTAREAEADVASAARAEVDAGHASDPPVLNQVFGHPPRERRGGGSAVRPARIDPEKRVERARRRPAAEHAAPERRDAVVKQVAPRPQFGPEITNAVLRALERADAAQLGEQRAGARRVERA